MVSIGDTATCNVLIANTLGSKTKPVQNIHRASTDYYQNDLSWKDADTDETRLRLKEDGHLQIVQDLELYTGPDIETGTKRYSVGLNSDNDFVIRDEIAQIDRLKIDSQGTISGLGTGNVSNLDDILQGLADNKQNLLSTESGVPINTSVLDTFVIASDGDGNTNNSLLTARAVENWFEQLQNSLLMISPGQQGPGFRVGSISASPSGVNVPSCLATANYLQSKLSNYYLKNEVNTLFSNLETSITLNFNTALELYFTVGNLTCTSYKCKALGYFENNETTEQNYIESMILFTNSSIVELYNYTIDFSNMFQVGDTIEISGVTNFSNLTIPLDEINTFHTVLEFKMSGSVANGVVVKTLSKNSVDAIHYFVENEAHVIRGSNFIVPGSDLLVHGGEIYDYIAAKNYASTTDLILKADLDSPAFSGDVNLPSTTLINGSTLDSTVEAHSFGKLVVNNDTFIKPASVIDPLQLLSGGIVIQSSDNATFETITCSDVHLGVIPGNTVDKPISSALSNIAAFPGLLLFWYTDPSTNVLYDWDKILDAGMQIVFSGVPSCGGVPESEINRPHYVTRLVSSSDISGTTSVDENHFLFAIKPGISPTFPDVQNFAGVVSVFSHSLTNRLAYKQSRLIWDSAPTPSNHNNVCSSHVISEYMTTNFMPLTSIDDVPSDGSTNLVTSNGVYDFVDNALLSVKINIETIETNFDNLSLDDIQDWPNVTATQVGYLSEITGFARSANASVLPTDICSIEYLVVMSNQLQTLIYNVSDDLALKLDITTATAKYQPIDTCLLLSGGTISGNLEITNGDLIGTAIGNVPLPSGTPSAGDVVRRNSANDAWEYTQVASSVLDTQIIENSTNAIQSGAVYNMFNSSDYARLHQDNYLTKHNESLGKALFQIWYGWDTVITTVTSLEQLILDIGLNSENFFTFNAYPGSGATGVNYHATTTPPVINVGPGDIKIDDISVSNHMLMRWTFTSYVFHNGTYNFKLRSNDGSRLQIRSTSLDDDETTPDIVINTDGIGTRTITGSKYMKKNTIYEIQVFYYDVEGFNTCKLEWQRPSIDIDFSVFSPYSNSPDFQYYHPDFTCVKNSAGIYAITFGPRCKPQSNSYTVLITSSNNENTIFKYKNKISSGFYIVSHVCNINDTLTMSNDYADTVNHGTGEPSTGDIPNTDANWLKYEFWNTSSASEIINTSASIYQVANSGVYILEKGSYEVTCQLCYNSSVQRADVAAMFSKNNILEGPVASMSYIRSASSQYSSGVVISHIFRCVENDLISINTSRIGPSGVVNTPVGYSQFKIKRIAIADDASTSSYGIDCGCDFSCISRGRTFCHGSINADGSINEEQNYA